MKKIGIVALAAIAALALGIGANMTTRTANAEVTDTVAVWCGFLDPIADCEDGVSAADIIAYDTAIGDGDGFLTPDELADIDVDANQITDASATIFGEILIFAFVDNDGTVSFDAGTGLDMLVSLDAGGEEAGGGIDANTETCDGAADLDCDVAVTDDGDGVVVATAIDGTADEGDSVDVDVFQSGPADSEEVSTQTINVVGSPFRVTTTLVETTIQTGAGAACVDDGGDPAVTDSDALSDAETTVVLASVVDNDDRALTRIAVEIESSDTDIADIGDITGGLGDLPNGEVGLTVDGGDSGIAAFAVVCGGDDTGDVDITSTIVGDIDDDTETLTVVGEPANVALTASPAAIACDGSATSTVTATVTDSDGNAVANGTNVNFSVVALGTANPINVATTDGTASSTITPLSGATAGVTVIVTAGTAQASLRVDCLPELASPTAPTGPTATPTSGVRPPDTGNGGYLGADSSAGFPLWALFALALGSLALVVGGKVYGRAR